MNSFFKDITGFEQLIYLAGLGNFQKSTSLEFNQINIMWIISNSNHNLQLTVMRDIEKLYIKNIITNTYQLWNVWTNFSMNGITVNSVQ